MSASHSEPMGARNWEPDFRTPEQIAERKQWLISEIQSYRNAFWNATRQGRTIPPESKAEFDKLGDELTQLLIGDMPKH